PRTTPGSPTRRRGACRPDGCSRSRRRRTTAPSGPRRRRVASPRTARARCRLRRHSSVLEASVAPWCSSVNLPGAEIVGRPAALPPMVKATADWSERSHDLSRLLARAGLGDRAAFATLYERTSSHLFAVVLRINRDRAQAEDILQEVYVNVWRAASSFDAAQSQPLTWLTSIARNRAIDSLRRQQTQPRMRAASAFADGGESEDDH